ncbi:MAG: universal stress protein [Anaerolineae bacterium]|jgi:nucleotide-binding universal stress UspA family protein
MGAIVCATRGGKASRATQERAIDLAKERGAELVFLCIVDPGFAGPMDEPLTCALNDELKRLGRSLLCIAQARAQQKGVDAKTVVRTGPVRESIETALREFDADTLVIGAPGATAASEAFGSGDVSRLADEVRQSTGVEVVLVT